MIKKITATDQEIIDSYLAGNSGFKVAKLLGTSQTQVRRVLERNGISGRSIKTDDELEKEIIQKYLDGTSSEKIASEYNMNGSTVCRILKRNGHEIRPSELNKRKYKIKFDWLDEINTEEKAYWYGFMLADGNVHNTLNSFKIVAHNKDLYILKRFGELIFDGDYPLYEDDPYSTLNITCKKMAHRLNELGCMPNKGFQCKFPDWLNLDLRRHCIRGLIDGDGCIYKNEDKNRFIVILTGNCFICKSVAEILKEQGIFNPSFQKIESKNSENGMELRINSRYDVYKTLNYIYKDSTIHLTRKYDKYLDFLKMHGEQCQQYDDIKKLNSEGLSNSKIAKKLNMIQSTVWRILHNEKLQ